MNLPYNSNCKLTYIPWKWLSLLLVITTYNPVVSLSQGTVHTHVFTDPVQEKVAFDDSLYIFVDTEKKYDIWDIVNSTDIEFQRTHPAMQTEPPFTVWTKLKLRNEGSSARHDYFSFCLEADTNWVYLVKDGTLLDKQLTGRWFDLSDKSFPSFYPYAPVSIDAGEEKLYYFRSLFTKPVGPEHFTHISIQPARPLLHRHFDSYIWHAFYAGIMLFFGGFSLFLFVLFRERIFIYFSSITLFFTLYFIRLQGMDTAFISGDFGSILIPYGQLIISGLLLSIFLFTRGYVRLKEKLPKYYPYFLAATVFVVPYTQVMWMLGMDMQTLNTSHNLLMVFWVVLLILPLIFLTIKNDKEARVLLISIGLLFFGTVMFLISINVANIRNAWLQYGFQLGSIAFSGILFYGLFDKINTIRSEQRRIIELDKLKSTFFANISHEFRTPLTLMKGPLQEVIDGCDDPKTLHLLKMAHRNADRQLHLVNQLLDLSKLDAGKMELGAQQDNFVPFLKGVVNAYQSLAVHKNVDLQLICPYDEVHLWFSRDKMDQIIQNLLSNAFKFTPSGGKVTVSLSLDSGNVVLTVSDTGRGISRDDLPHVFDRFFQGNLDKYTEGAGSGIGLALVRDLVQLHGGTISVTSKIDHGSTFKVEIPLGKNHLATNDLIDGNQLQSLKKSVPDTSFTLVDNLRGEAFSSESYSNEVPHLLVIEDNGDVRAYIRFRLENSFQISEASDGQQGINMAMDLMPDIIISDVMMPESDGFELCHTLKTDIRTCHIPIILLTARAEHEAKMEGLETGADDYLTKPFNSEELELRALNLVRLRRQLKERFAESITLRPSEVTTNSLDQSFLDAVLNTIEANLSNDQFGIDTLTKEIGISKSNLNNKLRALINQSTNQLIQSVRLQRALDLLEQKAGTVSEVAHQTGFKSTAYFIKCFKAKYGKTPGALLKEA